MPRPGLSLLEPRLAPSAAFPDFGGPVEEVSVLGGVAAAGAGVGGGPRVRVSDGGRVVFDQFVFESSFRGGVHVALADVDRDGRVDLCVGAGPGGGPRLRVFRDAGAGYELAADYYAFEPSFRGGVYVAGWGTHLAAFAGDGGGPVGILDGVSRLYGPADARDTTGWAAEDATGDGVPEVFRCSPSGTVMYAPDGTPLRAATPLLAGVQFPPPALAAVPHPEKPGNVALADRELAAVPAWLQRYLRATGLTVQVYAGTAVTDLPEYAYLCGVPTPAAGDGDRTYDRVDGIGPVNWVTPAVVREDLADVTLHEVGHGVWVRLTPEGRGDWIGVWWAVGWPTSYERTNETEAFGASFRRWVHGAAGEPAAVTDFFAGLAGRLIPDARCPFPGDS